MNKFKHLMRVSRTVRVLVSAVCLLTITAQTLNAQEIAGGIEIGGSVINSPDTNRAKAGFSVGGFGELSLKNGWFLDAALRLSSQPIADKKDFKYNDYQPSEGVSINPNAVIRDEYKFTPYYLTLPVRAGYKFDIPGGNKISLAAGPIIGIGLWGGGKTELFKQESAGNFTLVNTTDVPNVFTNNSGYEAEFSSRMEYGFNVRLGIELNKHWRLGLDYSRFHIAGDCTRVANLNSSALTVGYAF